MDAKRFPKIQALLHHGSCFGFWFAFLLRDGHISRNAYVPPCNGCNFRGWFIPPIPAIPTTESSLSLLHLVTLSYQGDLQTLYVPVLPKSFYSPLLPSTQVHDRARIRLIWRQDALLGYCFEIIQCTRMRRPATLGNRPIPKTCSQSDSRLRTILQS